MKRVLTAVVLALLVLLVLFKAPMWLFTLVVGVVAMGATREYLGLVDAYGVRSMKTSTTILVAIVFISLVAQTWVYSSPLWVIFAPGLLFFFPLLLLTAAMTTDNLSEALPRAACSALVVPYVILTLLCLVLIRDSARGLFLILFMFAIVWSGDIFAYYAGRAFGKHKLAPRISPGKTWEGTVASFVGSLFLAHILFVDNHQIMDALFRWQLASLPDGLSEMSRHERLMQGLLLGACVNVAAQTGDLVESMIKRGANVKDSGSLLPGHGGILDRIDALLFAAPVVAIYSIFGR